MERLGGSIWGVQSRAYRAIAEKGQIFVPAVCGCLGQRPVGARAGLREITRVGATILCGREESGAVADLCTGGSCALGGAGTAIP